MGRLPNVLILGVALALPLALASTALATGHDTPVQMDGTDCREVLVITPVPAGTAAEFVPAAYTPVLDPLGRAIVFAGLKECAEIVLDGASIGAASTSDVGVMVESPDGTGGIHYYQTWWNTDNAALAATLGDQGWAGDHTPQDVVRDKRDVDPTAGALYYQVFWAQGGNYAGSITGVHLTAPGETVATGWHDGPAGTVAVHKTLTSSVQGYGLGAVTASEGSQMEDLLGTTFAHGVGLYAEYDMVGSVGPLAGS